MSSAKKLRERPEVPKALICGMLSDGGRVLFLVKKDQHGVERLELPWVYSYQTTNPVSQLGEIFLKQTGIDAEVGEIKLEAKHNAGSRRKKNWISCYVFEIKAKNKQAHPSSEFVGFRWVGLKEVKKEKLGRMTEWIMKLI
ncbi:MAG: hypothetical protein ABH983_00540 [Candidatus Micrarchaeota archaeon]|nr:hypothetical protein [Candidatus Micrarchaeota archaeon]MBU1681326.1 hypothetical protein [Candidatus Micrarchaeota archaeon]